MHKILILFLVIISAGAIGQEQTIGVPSVYNYSKSDYRAGTQNWGITQDQYGFMYFANNEGVLRFDGIHWDLVEVSETSPVRSVMAGDDYRIYVGLFNDFGYLEKDQAGYYEYHSLRHLLPENVESFDNIWKIYQLNDQIVFQSFDYIFILHGDHIKTIAPDNRFHFSFKSNDRFFAHEPDSGLYEYLNGKMELIPATRELQGKEIWSVLNTGPDTFLLATARNGIYRLNGRELEKWNTPAGNMVETYQLFNAAKISDNLYAFGTILNGLIISDARGNIIRHINRERGLRNNTVLSIYCDQNENLWLGLDNGISYIENNSPVTYVSDSYNLGTGYTARIFDNKLYLGTNQGLFVRSFSEGQNSEDFVPVKNTTGQVWSLDVFNNQLICGHNTGTYVIHGTTAEKISSEEGAWNYIAVKNNPDLLIGIHYNSLVRLKFGKTGWQYAGKVKGFDESSRNLFQDEQGTLWTSQASKGIYQIKLNDAADSVLHYRLYNSADGLPSDKRNIMFSMNGEKFASTVNGLYSFKSDSGKFIVSDKLNQLFDLSGQLKTFKTDSLGNIWFISENESGVLRINEDMSYTKITAPFRQLDNQYVKDFEFVYPYDPRHALFGIDNGFAFYSGDMQKHYNTPFQSYITRLEIPHMDSVMRQLEGTTLQRPHFPHKKNSFTFHYAAPFFEHHQNLQFSYLLENYSPEWSEWTNLSFKEFTNLPEGNYNFKVKARNIYGTESGESAFEFRVLAPWYRSVAAYYIYLVMFALLVFFSFRFFLYRIDVAKSRERLKHRLEIREKEERFKNDALMAEKEIIRLRNEKLQNEMVYRDKELVNQTMGVIQKNKFLAKINDELIKMQKSVSDEALKKKLSSLGRNINKEIDDKQQNQIFETYFEEVHSDFFERLKKQYPQVSPREMRLCAYIRMNLTSKEIAALLNISDRGVEISRYRLRKKLDLPRETNLSTFLSNV